MALNISYNLGTSAADASIARARIQQNQIEVQLRQLDLQVTSDVSNAAIAGSERGGARPGCAGVA